MKAFILSAVILLTCTQVVKSNADDSENNGNVDVAYQEIQPLENDLNNQYYDDYNSDDDDEDNVEDEAAALEKIERIYGINIEVCENFKEIDYPIHVSHPVDCNRFYKCSNGRGYLFDCPSYEHWSVGLDRCDYPDYAGCNIDGTYQYNLKKIRILQANEEGKDLDEDDDDESEVDPRCEGSDPYKPTHLAHPNECTKFYKCYMGRAYVIKCPRGQHYNARANRCDHPGLARCHAKPLNVKPASIKAASIQLAVPYMDIPEEKLQKNSIVDDPDYIVADPRCRVNQTDRFHPTHFAHPLDCQMFYKCFNKLAHKVSCPQGLHFNRNTNACDYPEVAKCDNFHQFQSVVPAQIQYSENIGVPSIPDCSHGRMVNFGIQGTLNRYFQCRAGEVYLMECKEPAFFNVNIMDCDYMPADNPRYQRPGQNNNNGPVMTPYKNMYGGYPNYQNNYYPNNNNFYPMWNNPMMQYPGQDQWMNFNPLQNNPGMDINYQPEMAPEMNQRLPEIIDNRFNMNPMPMPVPVYPEMNQIPQLPMPVIPEAPIAQMPEFPSWLPEPNYNMNLGFPVVVPEAPQNNNNNNNNNNNADDGFDFARGQFSSRCPTHDDAMNPIHLPHESDCGKFYKCFQRKAFLMACPQGQEWSDELQRCDYHMFANCDPVELIKRRIQN